MKRLATFTATLVLLLCSAAQANTTIIKMNGSPNDYQGWERASLIRTPAATLSEWDLPDAYACHASEPVSACTDGATWIFIDPVYASPAALFHELGHVYDHLYLTPSNRAELQSIICAGCAPGTWSAEYWCDSYSLIARKAQIDPNWLYVSEPSSAIPGWKLIAIRNWIRTH